MNDSKKQTEESMGKNVIVDNILSMNAAHTNHEKKTKRTSEHVVFADKQQS